MGVNRLCQGTCADIVKRAMVRCGKLFLQENALTRIIMNVHDELIFKVPNGTLPDLNNEFYLIPKIVQIMEDNHDLFQVPLSVDVEYSNTNWADKTIYKGLDEWKQDQVV